MQSKREKEQSRKKWHNKFAASCQKYQWALDYLQQETGLLHLHCSKTPSPLPVRIDGKSIDLSQYPFIVQKQAVLPEEYLKKHPEKTEQAKQSLKSLFQNRLAKGFSDPRQSLSKNYGFIADQPIQIDTGKIVPFSGDTEQELERIFQRVDRWFESHAFKTL